MTHSALIFVLGGIWKTFVGEYRMEFEKYFKPQERGFIQKIIERGDIDSNDRFVTGPKAENLKGKIISKKELGAHTYNPLKQAVAMRMKSPEKPYAHRVLELKADHINKFPPELVKAAAVNIGPKKIERLRNYLNKLAEE